MPKINLTHRGIPNLKAGKWLTEYWDEGLPGFGVRVHHTGRKSFIVRYQFEQTRRRVTLGVFPVLSLVEARRLAKEILGRVARGEDPQQEKQADKAAETFGELAAIYMEHHAKAKKKSWKGDQRILEADLLPHWRHKKAKNITRKDVTALLDGIMARGAPIMANRTKALISKIYNIGIGRDIVEHNPCLGVASPGKARQRDRVLNEGEIRALWRALDDQHPVVAATFKLRLLTAQRRNEVLTMRWEHIDGDWWTIPAEVAKNGLAHRVPLSRQSLALLDELRPLTGQSEWVFESPRQQGSHIVAVQKAAERIAQVADVEFRGHDLRRTAASLMTSMGISRLVVAKLLNHVESGVTAIYDRHSYDGEKREAMELWGSTLEEILSDSDSSLARPA